MSITGYDRITISELRDALEASGLDVDEALERGSVPDGYDPLPEETANAYIEVINDVGDEYAELIPEGDLAEYAQEYAESNLGLSTSEWPLSQIDWGMAADELVSDLTEVQVEGHTFYIAL